MFDLTSSKLLILGIVALLVVGPKDLPMLLRTVGRYLGVIRRHAADFRAQFDEAMRQSELDQIQKEFSSLQENVNKSVMDAEAGFKNEMASVQSDVDGALGTSEPVGGHPVVAEREADKALEAPKPGVEETAQLPEPVAEPVAVPVVAHPGVEHMKSGA
jgi:sec-independent protein translocase protein TatB